MLGRGILYSSNDVPEMALTNKSYWLIGQVAQKAVSLHSHDKARLQIITTKNLEFLEIKSRFELRLMIDLIIFNRNDIG